MRWAWFWVCALVAMPMACVVVSPVSAQVDSGSDAEARRRFDEGRVHFDAGEFAEAANAFRRAYLLSPRFPLLYNIGQAELRAGRDGEALEAFEGFLRQAPADDARRSEVEERARVLRAMGVAASSGTVVATSETSEGTEETEDAALDETHGTASEEAEPSEAAVVPASSTDGGSDPTPWIIVGVGGAVAVAGAILLALGVTDAGSVTGAVDGARWSDLEGAAGRANAEFGAGIALLGVGVVAMGVGVAWGATSGGGENASARVTVGPGGISLSGTF